MLVAPVRNATSPVGAHPYRARLSCISSGKPRLSSQELPAESAMRLIEKLKAIQNALTRYFTGDPERGMSRGERKRFRRARARKAMEETK